MKFNSLMHIQPLRHAARLAAILICGWALAACTPEVVLIQALQQPKYQRLSSVGGFSEEGQRVLYRYMEGYPEVVMYMMLIGERELSEIILDDDTFHTYVIGAYLAHYPDMTYEQFRENFDIPELDYVTPETFNYYRAFGENWIDDLQNAKWMDDYLERYALLEERLGDYLYDLWFGEVGRLLQDDDRLLEVLTDQNAAVEFLEDANPKLRHLDLQDYHLGPIYTGVSPATGS